MSATALREAPKSLFLSGVFNLSNASTVFQLGIKFYHKQLAHYYSWHVVVDYQGYRVKRVNRRANSHVKEEYILPMLCPHLW